MAKKIEAPNQLFFGDNLHVLRESIKDESIDLVYLDPPFNSNATYNVLFRTPKGHKSDAQIEAFDDTWHWGEHAEAAYAELLEQENTNVAEVIRALRNVLRESDMMAYLAMMAIRLVELHRVLKPTGSLYLHCDPSASHYLKVVLDQVFGPELFVNEIIWKRQSAHNDATTKFASITDTILFYAKSENTEFQVVRKPLDPEYVAKFYRHKDPNGRMYRLSDLSAPEGGGMAKVNPTTGKPNGWYEWKGYSPPARGWRFSPETMQKAHDEDRLYYPADKTQRIAFKRYLDENEGQPVSNLWDDIPPLSGAASESMGYPTQKPLALLERVIAASSSEGEVVLDPFCGCGTAVDAAHKMKRRWIGIDVTHLAVSLIEKRMRDRYPGITFDVQGTPKDFSGARDLAERDKYQFQWWACSLVNARPFQGKKKGADSGIDGLIFFTHDEKTTGKVVVSVKGGENISVAMVRDFAHVIEREKAAIGFFVTLKSPTKPMIAEAAGTGFYTSPITGGKFPRLQILTIEGLLNGTEQARYPHLDGGALTFKKAKLEEKASEQKKLF